MLCPVSGEFAVRFIKNSLAVKLVDTFMSKRLMYSEARGACEGRQEGRGASPRPTLPFDASEMGQKERVFDACDLAPVCCCGACWWWG